MILQRTSVDVSILTVILANVEMQISPKVIIEERRSYRSDPEGCAVMMI